jgi:hypothetical protein
MSNVIYYIFIPQLSHNDDVAVSTLGFFFFFFFLKNSYIMVCLDLKLLLIDRRIEGFCSYHRGYGSIFKKILSFYYQEWFA